MPRKKTGPAQPMTTPPAGPVSGRRDLHPGPAALCLVAVGMAVAFYWRTLDFEFIDLDDVAHVLANSHVMAGLTWEGVRRAFFDLSAVVDYWHPVSTLSLMLDATLYGKRAGGYHATSLLLHAANVALVFLLMLRMTAGKWTAFVVAAFFAVHPLHLESVVWITERKDVLFMFWGLLALVSYLAWARSRSRTALAALYGCYVLSLMSKPVLVVLPVLLLLLDYWPLGRWNPYGLLAAGRTDSTPGGRLGALWPLLREKLPLFALALLSGLATIFSHPKTFDLVELDAAARFGNAFLSVPKYVWKLFVPTDLAILYPFPASLPVLPLALSVLALAAALLLVVWQGRRFPWLPVGVGWFLLGFLTTIVSPRAGIHVAMADRFAYFPFVGAYLVLALGAREAASRMIADPQKRFAALSLCFLALLGWYQAQAQTALPFWRNRYAIYERALDVTSGHYLIHNNYGKILLDRMDVAKAESHVLKALELQPGYNLALGNLGNVYMATGRYEQAIAMFRSALAVDPGYVFSKDDHYGIAFCLARLGRYAEAEESYRKVLAIDPGYPQAYNDLGNIALLRKDMRAAEAFYAQAVALAPDYQVARDNLMRVRLLLAGGGK